MSKKIETSFTNFKSNLSTSACTLYSLTPSLKMIRRVLGTTIFARASASSPVGQSETSDLIALPQVIRVSLADAVQPKTRVVMRRATTRENRCFMRVSF